MREQQPSSIFLCDRQSNTNCYLSERRSQMWRTPLLVAVGIKTRVQDYNSFLGKL
ncbi:MAG: hypothetical protein V7L01_34845 [Nostoc sp.]|uniref:hypothetical protein n=1 Tax=Nostoc sp. TaxID=1180 RepID=UPI002FFABA12